MAAITTSPALVEERVIEGKRLNLILSESAYTEVRNLAKATNQTITTLVRLGLSLVRIAMEEARQGNKLVITKASGEPIKEIVLPT